MIVSTVRGHCNSWSLSGRCGRLSCYNTSEGLGAEVVQPCAACEPHRHAHEPGARVIRTAHSVGYAFSVQLEGLPSADGARHWLVVDGRRVDLHEGENLIGRDASAHVTLDLYSVSRAHARIIVGNDGAWIEDRCSKNATRVGDQPVTVPTALRDGDRLHFGTVSAICQTSRADMSTETHTVDVDLRSADGSTT